MEKPDIPALTVDGVHPSAAGYAVMTPHTEQAIQAAIATVAQFLSRPGAR